LGKIYGEKFKKILSSLGTSSTGKNLPRNRRHNENKQG
jgi:hypothetical protein